MNNLSLLKAKPVKLIWATNILFIFIAELLLIRKYIYMYNFEIKFI